MIEHGEYAYHSTLHTVLVTESLSLSQLKWSGASAMNNTLRLPCAFECVCKTENKKRIIASLIFKIIRLQTYYQFNNKNSFMGNKWAVFLLRMRMFREHSALHTGSDTADSSREMKYQNRNQ